jgi:DNA-binding XRE family transcriptional regulator
MNKQKVLAPWQVALNELRAKTGTSHKALADALNVSDKTIIRLFTGEAKKPDFYFVSQVIRTLGGSVSEILGEGGAYIVSQDIITLQAQYDELKQEHERLREENEALRAKNAALTDELLDVVNYFIKNKPKE